MTLKRNLLAATALALVAACSSLPQKQNPAQRQAAYAAAAGTPVNNFRFFAPLWSWEPLGSDQVVVYTKPKEAWLLDVPGCAELPYASALGVTSYLNEVSINIDKVVTNHSQLRCAIKQIRPVDVRKLSALQQAQRQIAAEPRPS